MLSRPMCALTASLALASAAAAAATHAPAQDGPAGTSPAVPTLTDSARVSLISILPGDDLYSLFGHSALRVRDPVLGVDRSYNFGTFDFGESAFAMADFIARFTYGDLEYMLSVQPARAVIHWYWEELGRASIEQELELTREEAQELFRRLEVNALPENRYYQYDFFFDNCATRLLDALEAVLGDRLGFEADPDPGLSFRRLLDPYLVGARGVDLGMDLGLGLPADRLATSREATFLPERLLDYFAAGRVRNGEGRVVPLVRSTAVLTGPADPAWPPPADPRWPTILAWALAAGGLVLTIQDARAGRASRRVVDGAFFGVLGLAGLAVAFLWFISLHSVTKTNFNLAWALPTHLVAALALVRGGSGARGGSDGPARAGGRLAGVYFAVTAVLAAILLAGMPAWPQELPAALVPLLLLIAVRAGWLGWARLAPGSRLSRRASPA